MVWCLTAPSHYLNQCRLIINKVLWHSSKTIWWYKIENCIFRTASRSPRDQWVDNVAKRVSINAPNDLSPMIFVYTIERNVNFISWNQKSDARHWITMTSYEHSIHRPLDCLFVSLFMPITKKSTNSALLPIGYLTLDQTKSCSNRLKSFK